MNDSYLQNSEVRNLFHVCAGADVEHLQRWYRLPMKTWMKRCEKFKSQTPGTRRWSHQGVLVVSDFLIRHPLTKPLTFPTFTLCATTILATLPSCVIRNCLTPS